MRSNIAAVCLRRFATICSCAGAFGLPAVAHAHVAFDAPLAGDTLVVGEAVSMAWTDVILHDPEGFDLDLLHTEEGDATPIVHGLSSETHTYEWVPEEACDPCFLRVTQLNTINYDYYETIPITISGSGSSGGSGGSGGSEASGGSAAEEGGGSAGSPEDETGGSPSAGSGASSSSAGGSRNTGGSATSGGGGGASGSTGAGARGGSNDTAGTSAGGASAGAPAESDDGAADEGCSSSPGRPARRSPAFLSLFLVAIATLRHSRPRSRNAAAT